MTQDEREKEIALKREAKKNIYQIIANTEIALLRRRRHK